ncbi:MAG: B12-binding domain-containing radical SAM protein [Candidatus Omnitrophica bacterium]|nr:B12-binding domain-containing radical SAM protein [Candidatus Omnitrophota bacterium]
MNTDFKIILIALYDWNALGVRTLHSVLNSNNINTTSIFFKLANPNNTMDKASEDEIDTLINLVKDIRPSLVAVSLRSTMFKLAAEITKKVKDELGVLTLWGGTHPTIHPEQSLGHADLVCIGEGERAITELAKKISADADYSDVDNLWVKKNGRIIKNRLSRLIDNLDSVPFADFTNENKYLIERGKILKMPLVEERSEYDIMTSRGCPFSCSYCCNSTYRKIYHGLGRYVRRRSVENVLAELKLAKKTFKSISYIYFYDDIFSMDKSWLEDFSFKYRKLIGTPFFCYVHPNYADEYTLRLLKATGLKDVTMGIQSGSKFIRDVFFRRSTSNAKIIDAANIFKYYDINVSYDILLDNPFEKETDRMETLQLLLKLPRPFQLHTHSLTYFPETELTKLALENGLISINDVEDKKQQSLHRWTTTLDYSRNEDNLFWDNLYYMAKKRYFPKGLILKLSQNKFLKKHPAYLTFLLKTFTYDIHSFSSSKFKIAYLTFNALKMIFSGDWLRFRSHFKMYLKRNFG